MRTRQHGCRGIFAALRKQQIKSPKLTWATGHAAGAPAVAAAASGQDLLALLRFALIPYCSNCEALPLEAKHASTWQRPLSAAASLQRSEALPTRVRDRGSCHVAWATVHRGAVPVERRHSSGAAEPMPPPASVA